MKNFKKLLSLTLVFFILLTSTIKLNAENYIFGNNETIQGVEELAELESQIKQKEKELIAVSEQINEGAFAFLKWSKENYPQYTKDIDAGLAILNEFKEKSDVNLEDPDDAAAYKNIMRTATYLERQNELRLQDENFKCTEQYTNFEILCKAIVSANRSTDPALSHRGTFNVAENLAWGFNPEYKAPEWNDPFYGWYTEEKLMWEFQQEYIKKYMEENPEATKEEATAKATEAREALRGKEYKGIFIRNTQIGHYLNIVTNYDITAIAVNTNIEANKYGATHAMNADFANVNTNKITQKDYREIIENYKKATDLEKIKSELNELKEQKKKLVRYSVTLLRYNKSLNTIDTSKTEASEDENVILTAELQNGEEFVTWKLIGLTLSERELQENPLKFKMPNTDVIAIAILKTKATDAEKYPAEAPDKKVEVIDTTSLSQDEKVAIKDAVMYANPHAVEVDVADNGDVTIKYNDGSTNTMKIDQVTYKKAAEPEQVALSIAIPSAGFNSLSISSLQPDVKIKVTVDGEEKLTTEELYTSPVGKLIISLEEPLRSGQKVEIIGSKAGLLTGGATVITP